MTKKTNVEKIELYFDYSKYDNTNHQLSNFAEKANRTVIPLMQSLGVEITLERVIKYAGNSEEFNTDFLESEKRKSEVGNAYLLQIVEHNATEKFNNAFAAYIYDDFTTNRPELLILVGGKVCINEKAVKEFCTNYLQEGQREAYSRYLKAIDALNDFYRGKAPDGYGGYDVGSQFLVKDGKVFPNRLINFDYYK